VAITISIASFHLNCRSAKRSNHVCPAASGNRQIKEN